MGVDDVKITLNPEFDQIYDIRLATREDIPSIMEFLGKYWRKDHIMANNRMLFEYEYVHGDEVDFVIAVNRKNDVIEGIFGFLRCTKTRSGDIWGSMWKVSDNPDNMKMLGIELAKRVYPLTGCKSHIGSGANPKTTVPLRKIFFHDKTAKMQQFYWLNPEMKDYAIIDVRHRWIPKKGEDAPIYRIKHFSLFEELDHAYNLELDQGIPHKDSWYIRHRFFEHPIYKYDAFGIMDENSVCKAVFFGRTIEVAESKIYRIVDYIGEQAMVAGLYEEIKELALRGNYEYIDFVEYGINEEYLTAAGFRNRDWEDNIVPNYFEPFLRENVDIWVHYKEDGTTFFKADGDQDRPNVI